MAAALPPAAGCWPLMYMWHDSLYLGGAHGMSGVLLMLLYCRQHLSKPELELVEAAVQVGVGWGGGSEWMRSRGCDVAAGWPWMG